MKSLKIPVLFALFWILLLSGNASADFTVVNLDTTGYSITGQTFNSATNTVVVNEDYNSTVLIPYPSHDGYGIENTLGDFFKENLVVGAAGSYALTFNVTNTTPYTWSDYHFVLGTGISLTSWTNTIFANSAFNTANDELQFWAPNQVSPGQTVTFTLDVNLAQGNLNLTQIATTETPIPGASWLFGSGVLGLIGLKRMYLR
jgi:hypothetical protein